MLSENIMLQKTEKHDLCNLEILVTFENNGT